MKQDVLDIVSRETPNQAPIDTPEVRDLLAFADSKGVKLMWFTDGAGRYAAGGMWSHGENGKTTSFAPQEDPTILLNILQQYFTEH